MTDLQLHPRDRSWQEIFDADMAAATPRTWQGVSGRPGDQTHWTFTISGDGPDAIASVVIVPPTGIPHVAAMRPVDVAALR